MNKRFLLILTACVVGLGVLYFVTKSPDSSTSNSSSSNATPTSHVTGKNAKKVSLIEYGDFQCPACKSYEPVVKAVIQKYNNDIQFQFRNFPLVSLHPNAFAASRAAEAASMQNKFWEMHDILYEQQEAWASSNSPLTIFENYARQLSLNVDKFKTDYSSSAVNDAINADIKAGNQAGADSTPTFVLNGKKLDKNPASQQDFEKLIADAIAAKKTN